MATRTATRRKAPTRSVNLGGGLSLSLQSKTKRAIKRNTAHSAEWRAAKFLGRHTWRGVLAGSRWTGRRATAVGMRATASGRQWAGARAKYGLTAPLVRLTTADGTEHVPIRDMRHRAQVMLGQTATPAPRFAGDEVRAAEPPERIWATSRRLDREEIDSTGCPHGCGWTGAPNEYGKHFATCTGRGQVAADAAGKETAVSSWGGGLEIFQEGYEVDNSHDLPELLQEASNGLAALLEAISSMEEDMKSHRVPPFILKRLADAAESVEQASGLFETASHEMAEHLEYMPTYGSPSAA
jgi:hypothetical protein